MSSDERDEEFCSSAFPPLHLLPFICLFLLVYYGLYYYSISDIYDFTYYAPLKKLYQLFTASIM